ncbi:MAG: PEP-CTERM sorting domain-containing protein [Burkholderiales bacterium]|nr:PEP-CTERM sorting domain-containing protein [Burkholderiales bacterium]
MNTLAPASWTKCTTSVGPLEAPTRQDERSRHSRLARRKEGVCLAVVAAVLGAGLCAPGTALAAEPYVRIETRLNENKCPSADYSQSKSAGPISFQGECFANHGGMGTRHSWYSAGADYGVVRATSKATVDRVDPFQSGVTFGGRSVAEFSGEYVFDGPARYVPIRLNLDLEGRMSLSPGIGIADGAALQVDAIVNSQRERTIAALFQVGSTDEARFERRSLDFPLLAPDAAWEQLASPGGAQLNLLTGTFTVPTGTPISIGLYLRARYDIRGAGAADLDFASGLSFNRDGPVFTLPEGYTVNGPGVVNNHWVGAIPAVPEPASALLSALGLGVVTWRARKRPR